jgi:hypothetical protein
MRSGDILRARYQSIDRSIIPHSQQRNVMQLSVCENKRLRLNAMQIRGRYRIWTRTENGTEKGEVLRKAVLTL